MNDMRKLGEDALEKGFIEFNVITGAINWANQFTLDKTGYTLKQLQQLTVFEIVPEQLCDRICDKTATIIGGKNPNFLIWPNQTINRQINWWYILQVKTAYPLRWVLCEYMQTTESSGDAFVSMCVQMDITNKYNKLSQRVNELDCWAKSKTKELADKQQSLEIVIKRGLKEHFDIISRKTDEHTAEILKLISSNVIYNKKISAFEQHIKMTIDLAIKSIAMQADRAGKGMFWKIIVPIFITAAVITIIQYIIWAL